MVIHSSQLLVNLKEYGVLFKANHKNLSKRKITQSSIPVQQMDAPTK